MAIINTGNLDQASSQSITETAILGSGCFWCTEAVFEELRGVIDVESGYSGGNSEHPTYSDVTSGLTGHAEVVKIIFDPGIISFSGILEAFWKTHDPTTLNRQGADAGTQYRSVIFYTTPQQKKIAEELKSALDSAGVYNNPIVTQISEFSEFYKAEEYHQDYYRKNPYAGYCQFVITPKMDKFRKIFSEKLK